MTAMTDGRPGAIIGPTIIQKGSSLKTRRTILFVIFLLAIVGCTSARAGRMPAGDTPKPAAAARPSLTAAQKQALQAIDDEAKKKAAPVALRFAKIVKDIYENMLADQPDEDLRAKLANEMKESTWELLSIKGQAIRDSVAVLTPEQKQILRTEMAKPGAPSDLTEVIGKTFRPASK
jgi:Spy/CpxP family protein refolding chaperone